MPSPSRTRQHPVSGSNSNAPQGQRQSEQEQSTTTNSGCLISRRRNILVQVLCRYLVHRRRMRHPSASSPTCSRTPSITTTPLQLLTNEEAQACGATCRICFEGQPMLEDDDEDNDYRLVAPCNCSGGSKWIHFKCLRQWQVQVLFRSFHSSATEITAASICNVCMAPYQVAPPPIMRLRRNIFHRGTLLVYNSNEATSTFYRTVVLLLNQPNNNGCPYGLVCNVPLGYQGRVNLESPGMNGLVSWRRGGPVCGGRLGVNKYIVAHTMPRGAHPQQHGQYLSIPVFDQEEQGQEHVDGQRQGHQLYILVSAVDRRPMVPALFNRHELAHVVSDLTHPPGPQEETEGGASLNRVFIFLGYCKWRSGQLDREVQRGSWRVCNNGTDRDVVRDDIGGLWNELTNSSNGNGTGRLLSPIQLLDDPQQQQQEEVEQGEQQSS